MAKSKCAKCGKTLDPVSAVLSRYCRQCADKGHAEVTGKGK